MSNRSIKKYKSILFSVLMVQAIIDGLKTQTRRKVKSPTGSFEVGITKDKHEPDAPWYYHDKCLIILDHHDQSQGHLRCPYGEVGDILMVKEPHRIKTDLSDSTNTTIWVEYSNDSSKGDDNYQIFLQRNIHPDTKKRLKARKSGPNRWVQGRYLPNDLVRLFLRITDIRIERLQDISEEDSKAEGVASIVVTTACSGSHTSLRFQNYLGRHDIHHPLHKWCYSAIASYLTLWDKINGQGSHIANPWVWVVNFERVPKPDKF